MPEPDHKLPNYKQIEKPLNRGLKGTDILQALSGNGAEKFVEALDAAHKRDNPNGRPLEKLKASELIGAADAFAISSEATPKMRASYETIRNAILFETPLEEVRAIRRMKSVNDAEYPGAEALRILKLTPEERASISNALPNKVFHRFQKDLKKAHRVNSENAIPEVVSRFSSPASHDELLSPEFRETSKKVRAAFPAVRFQNILEVEAVHGTLAEVPIENQNALFASDRKLETTNERLSRAQAVRIVLEKNYGEKITTAAQLLKALDVSKERLEILQSPSSVEMFNYLKNRPGGLSLGPSLLSSRVDGFEAIASNYQQLRKSLSITPAEIDLIAQRAGQKLDNVDFGELVGQIPNLTEKKKILTSADFGEFLNSHPGLVNSVLFAHRLNAYGMASLLQAYENKDELELRTKLLEPFQSEKIKLVEGRDAFHKEKIQLLEKFQEKGFAKLVVGRGAVDENINWGAQQEEEFAATIKALSEPIATELYDAFVNLWNLSRVPIALFVEALRDKEVQEFFLNEVNARKFVAIQQEMKIPERAIFHQTFAKEAISRIEQLNEQYKTFTDPKTASVVRAFLKDFEEPRSVADDDPFILLTAESRAISIAGLVAKSPENLPSALPTLTKTYGFTPRDLRAFTELFNEQDLQEISDPSVQQEFQRLELLAKKRTLPEEKGLLLKTALNLVREPKSKNALETLLAQNVSLRDPTDFEFALVNIVSETKFQEQLQSKDFLALWQRVSSLFYREVRAVTQIPDLVELDEVMKSDPAAKSVIFSKRFDEVLKFAREELSATELSPSMLLPIVEAALDFNRRTYSQVVSEFGPKELSTADLPLIRELSRNPELRAEVRDRPALLLEARELTKGPPVQRTVMDTISDDQAIFARVEKELREAGLLDKVKEMRTAEKAAQTDDERKKLRVEILEFCQTHKSAGSFFMLSERMAPVLDKYTERPSLEKMTNLDLLRIVLVGRALENPQNLAQLGAITWEDTNFKGSEFGFEIGHSSRRLTLLGVRPAKSLQGDDGSFESTRSGFLGRGFVQGHLHAVGKDYLENLKKELDRESLTMADFAGPSGSGPTENDNGGGDIGYSLSNRVTIAVATFLGHPKNSDGSEDTTKAVLNVDVSFKGLTYDLGNRTVPYEKSPVITNDPQLRLRR